MPIYKNVGGTHHTQDGRTIKNGEVFEDPDPQLHKTFVNKFEPQAQQVVPTPNIWQAPPGAPVATPPAAPPVEQVDVTADFPTAVQHSLQVLKGKAGYSVLDDGDPVNEAPLKNKKAVRAAIAEYTESTDPEDDGKEE